MLDQLDDDAPKPSSELSFAGQEHAARHMEGLGMRIAERDFRTPMGQSRRHRIRRRADRLRRHDTSLRRRRADEVETRGAASNRPPHGDGFGWNRRRSQRPAIRELRFDAIDVTINAANELRGLEHRVLATERTDGSTADSDRDRGDGLSGCRRRTCPASSGVLVSTMPQSTPNASACHRRAPPRRRPCRSVVS